MFSLIEIENFNMPGKVKALAVGAQGGYSPAIMGVLTSDRLVPVMPAMDQASYKVLAAVPVGIKTHVVGNTHVYSFQHFVYNNEHQREQVLSAVVIGTPASPGDRLVSELTFHRVEVDISIDDVKAIFRKYGYEEESPKET